MPTASNFWRSVLPGRRAAVPPKPEDFLKPFSAKDLPGKLKELYHVRTEDRSARIRLNRIWTRTALYYQGFQQTAWNEQTQSIDVYESEMDYYSENQFRKDVTTNVATLSRLEVEPSVRPSSDNPDDVTASTVANMALDTVFDDIGYSRVKSQKYLALCLFGNALLYTGYQEDPRLGVVRTPKFKYENHLIPPMSFCPSCQTIGPASPEPACANCGTQTEALPGENILSKVADGSEEQTKGKNFTLVAGPLETFIRIKSSSGLDYQPYLIWEKSVDVDIVRSVYGKAAGPNRTLAGTASEDNALFFIDVLANSVGGGAGGYLSPAGVGRSSRGYTECRLSMMWIRPDLFRGDPELHRKFPRGLAVDLVNGVPIDDTWREESIDDCWTQHIFLPNFYSAWGDGLVDALPVQDQLNDTNGIITRYLRYCAMGKKLVDKNFLNEENWSNDPAEHIIPVQVHAGEDIRKGVADVGPTPISTDVNQWKQSLYKTYQDMTGAFDVTAGKEIGANAPYSAYVFLNERSQGRFLPVFEMNRPSMVRWIEQHLGIVKTKWTYERQRAFIDNTGKWSFDQFRGSEIGAGNFDITIADTEARPKARAEKLQGMEMWIKLQPMLSQLSTKERLWAQELIGMPIESTPASIQVKAAYRDIQRILKGDTDVVPMPVLTDFDIYLQTFREFLLSDKGAEIQQTNGQLWSVLYGKFMTAASMKMMQEAQMPGGVATPTASINPAATPAAGPPAGRGAPPSGTTNTRAIQPPAGPPQPAPPLPPGPQGQRIG